MGILGGFAYVIIGVFFVWAGSLQIILNAMPHDIAMKAAKAHGAWMRENIFHLPPIKDNPPTKEVKP